MIKIFETIIRLSFSASWLIAAVVLVRFFGKKIPKKYVCVLWLLVGVRLVFPFTIESKISLVPKESAQAAVQVTGFMKQESVEDIFLSSLKEDEQYTLPELQIPPTPGSNVTIVSETKYEVSAADRTCKWYT